MPSSAVARVHRALEPLHSMVYFVPEGDEEYQKVGLRPGRMGYFASRSAAMGPVAGGVTAATFYNFNPTLVARHIPRAWGLASIPDVLAARLVVVDRALRRLLTDEVVGSPQIREAADLTRAATEGLSVAGRPLFAGHADLPWPEQPHLALWHGITLLREFRGDGHIAALTEAGVSGLDALITHVATGFSFTEPAAKLTRGWSDEEWAAGCASLTERGLLAGNPLGDGGGLTDAGNALRTQVETATDRADTAAWSTLGEERTARLVEIVKPLSATVAAGAFTPGVFAAR